MLIHTRLEGHVEVPIEAAMAFSRDINTLPLWHVMVVAVKDVKGSFDDAGSTATLTMKALDGLHDFRVEVTQAEPMRVTVQHGRQVDGLTRYTSTMHYEPTAGGFDWTWEQESEVPDGIPGPFGSEAFLTRFFEQSLRQSAEKHALLLEALVPQPV